MVNSWCIGEEAWLSSLPTAGYDKRKQKSYLCYHSNNKPFSPSLLKNTNSLFSPIMLRYQIWGISCGTLYIELKSMFAYETKTTTHKKTCLCRDITDLFLVPTGTFYKLNLISNVLYSKIPWKSLLCIVFHCIFCPCSVPESIVWERRSFCKTKEKSVLGTALGLI